MSEMRRLGDRTVHLRTTCSKEGESEEEEIKQRFSSRCSENGSDIEGAEPAKCRVFEIGEVRHDDVRNVRGIHCVERGKDKRKKVVERSTIFLIPLYQ